jgi:hypothetical protein
MHVQEHARLLGTEKLGVLVWWIETRVQCIGISEGVVNGVTTLFPSEMQSQVILESSLSTPMLPMIHLSAHDVYCESLVRHASLAVESETKMKQKQ